MSLDLAGLAPAPIDLGVLPSELDEGIASRAAIGLVVLATDQTMEHEFRALLRLPGVAVRRLCRYIEVASQLDRFCVGVADR